MVFPNAHSSERRFRAEVVGSLGKHVARVDVGVPLHSGSESRDLVLSHFDHFLAFRRAARKKVGNGILECALERAPFQSTSG